MSKILLDACVLYPTVMREALIGAARAGLFIPLWSDRILEEWARAAARLGPEGEMIARGEIVVLNAHFPRATVPSAAGVEARLYLPDENDIHVLASAITGHADAILTMNRKDFPGHILAEEGLDRLDPDNFLRGFCDTHPQKMHEIAMAITQEAKRLSGLELDMRKLFKKARLPRFGKAVEELE
ncbi:RSP_2648 family PIN domain-containing protein [Falsihalocynthiibacter sp. SS001]|uniref:RSP_2648 family PIN domain-containing protein n=1 Tax=Falsihalocynthiibacter sp. SS001 TaxID=3349698 RepID=UPI0036D272DC